MATILNRKENIEFFRYYYLFNTYIITEKTQINIDDFVISINIYKDYNNLIFPILILKVSLNAEYYKLIRDNNVRIRINSVKKLISETDEQSNASTIKEEIFLDNEIFDIIDKNKIMFNDNDLNEEAPSLNCTFVLFSSRHMKANKKLFNGNFLNCRIIDILSMIQNVSGSSILIEKPSNMTKYEQIFLPAMNSMQLLDYLQTTYSIYNHGIRTFFDYNEGIIMNNFVSTKTPQVENDYKNVVLDIVTDNVVNQSTPYNVGYKSNNGNYYYIKTPDTGIRVSDNSRIKQEILGSKRTIFSKNQYLSTEEMEWTPNEEDIKVEKKKLYYDNFNNPYFNEKETMSVNAITAVLNFMNLDVSTFKPNKLFLCTINNKDYELIINNVAFSFTKDKDSGVYICNGSCYLINNE